MPVISFVKSYPPIEVTEGSELMESLLKHDLPVASSCGGDGICSKCKVQILEGFENLSTESDKEKQLKQRNRISKENRISCQAKVLGNITIDTNYW